MKVLTLVPRMDVQRRIERTLRAAKFIVEITHSVTECIQTPRLAQYQGLLVDSSSLAFDEVLLLVELVRHENPGAAIFVFASRLELDHRLRLFEAGADECVPEPFFAAELAVRLGLSVRLHKAASDRSGSVSVLRSGDLELNLIRRTASRSGKQIDLRPKEFLLLVYLVRNVNHPVTRTMLLEHVWNSSLEGLTNVVDVYISALRGKIDRDFTTKLIQTNRGVGYTLRCPEESDLAR